MMIFTQDKAVFTATNSIKPVTITKGITGFWLDLPNGDLYEDHKQMFCYDSFEEAKRYAETNVGMKMNWEDF